MVMKMFKKTTKYWTTTKKTFAAGKVFEIFTYSWSRDYFLFIPVSFKHMYKIQLEHPGFGDLFSGMKPTYFNKQNQACDENGKLIKRLN